MGLSNKIIMEKTKGREFCLFFAIETGEKGAGKCVSSSLTTLTTNSSNGSWKGLVSSMQTFEEKLSRKYFDMTDLEPYLPIEPK